MNQKRHTTKAKLNALKLGLELPIDPCDMGKVGQVLPTDARAVHILAREYQRKEDSDYVSVSWPNQVKAADFFNLYGLVKTLNEILSLNPNGLD